MSQVPKSLETNITIHYGSPSPRHVKRFNLNPFHYLTLLLKSDWNTVGPAVDKVNTYGQTVSVILGTLTLLGFLEARGFRAPHWPWAKDDKSNPSPSFKHDNEQYSVDDLADEKLMEMLEETKKVNEGEEGPGVRAGGGCGGKPVPEPNDMRNVLQQEAEEQFMKDAEEGVEDLVEEMELQVSGMSEA